MAHSGRESCFISLPILRPLFVLEKLQTALEEERGTHFVLLWKTFYGLRERHILKALSSSKSTAVWLNTRTQKLKACLAAHGN